MQAGPLGSVQALIIIFFYIFLSMLVHHSLACFLPLPMLPRETADSLN